MTTTTTAVTDDEALFLVGVAMRLAGLIHFYDPAEARELLYGGQRDGETIPGLTPAQLRDLPYVLAALVPVDRTPDELLAWRGGFRAPTRLRYLTAVAPAGKLLAAPGEAPGKTHLAECGTRRGYLRHIRDDNGDTCTECEIANRAWERTRMADRRDWESRQATAQNQDQGAATTTSDDDCEDTADAA